MIIRKLGPYNLVLKILELGRVAPSLPTSRVMSSGTVLVVVRNCSVEMCAFILLIIDFTNMAFCPAMQGNLVKIIC